MTDKKVQEDINALEDIYDQLIIARGLVNTISELLTPITENDEAGEAAMLEVYRRRKMLDISLMAVSEYLVRAINIAIGEPA